MAVLKNRKYIGEYMYGDIPVKGGCPPIIETSLFDRVQGRIALRRRTGAAATAKVEYLLQGKLFCGLCSSPITAESGRNGQGVIYNYYACSKKKKKHTCVKANERKDFLEWYVVEQTLLYVLAPDRLKYIAQSIVAEYDKEFDVSGISVLEKKIALLEGAIQNTMDLCINAKTEALRDRFMRRCEELDVQKADMEIDLSKLRVAASIRYTTQEVTAWLRLFCSGDPMDIPFRRRIIDTFINSVFLYDEKLVIYYNIKDAHQISYIEAIGASSELENLHPVHSYTQKNSEAQTVKSSNFGKFV